jgi:hypothetical protein
MASGVPCHGHRVKAGSGVLARSLPAGHAGDMIPVAMPSLPRVVADDGDSFSVFTTEGEDPEEMTWWWILHQLVRRDLAPEIVDAWLHPDGPGTVLKHDLGDGTTTLQPAPGEPGMAEPWEVVEAWSGNRSRDLFEGAELRDRVAEARALRAAWLAARAAENTRSRNRRVSRDAEGRLWARSDDPREEQLLSGALSSVLTLERPEEAVVPGGEGYYDGFYSVVPSREPTDDETEPCFGIREPWFVCVDFPYYARQEGVFYDMHLEGEELRRLVAEARLLDR